MTIRVVHHLRRAFNVEETHLPSVGALFGKRVVYIILISVLKKIFFSRNLTIKYV